MTCFGRNHPPSSCHWGAAPSPSLPLEPAHMPGFSCQDAEVDEQDVTVKVNAVFCRTQH